MRTFLVAYDLAKPDLNQVYLANAIMGFGAAWARPLQNVWYVRSEDDGSAIEARLSRLLDDDDGLIVQEARGDALLANTGVRWFRQRRVTAAEDASNIVPFPSPSVTPPETAEALRAAG